ncbi:DNA-binding response regulator [Anaerocolumna cellulosilytica]|uniref:Stage 0 sporulation protein A homolog n=1 Tax=Anaerocolumna cellulosilytica TaxID=433286 RepID=A0A6S6RDK1_9FIRM|nr:response regulator transcription factor [Anaerocolumna cellulosilytica]MBB5195327.1 DNA-binding response OmpR family regulator [Anaerocolumna cellulosilytica]BCJ96801.1 DNA-binding response regulator [Anaerocolumna cellulosilytica]
MINILLVEDEKNIAFLLYANLTQAGYDCVCVYNGTAAVEKIDTHKYDLILLDIMLPEIDGYDLAEYIRPKKIPIIFLTAKSSVLERVKGLKLGADDYIVKPFEMIELLARVEAVLRRYNLCDTKISFMEIEIDTISRKVTKGGRDVALTVKEYDMLLFFIRNKSIALFRDKIYESVWGGDYTGDSRTVDLHVQRLRKKLNWEDTIISVYKIGYRLDVPKNKTICRN